MTLRLVPRAQALAEHPAFGALLLQLQRVVHDEQPELWETMPAPPALPRHAGNRVWRVDNAIGGPARIDRYVRRLARGLARLLPALGAGHWLVLPLQRRAWWAGATDERGAYPALARARSALPRLPRRFAGGLRFGADSAEAAVRLWFWSRRRAAPAGDAWATAGTLPLMVSLCQYGNLHLEVYDAGLLRRLDEVAAACGLAPTPGSRCDDRFARRRQPAGPPPRFAFDERVRVARPGPAKIEALGMVGVVTGRGDPRLPGGYGVYLEDFGCVWAFDEDELESTGVFAGGDAGAG